MLFRWLTSVASKASKNSDDADERSTSAPPPVSRAPDQTDEERIRKFLEALGQPAGTKPPAPVAPRQMDVERAAREARPRIEQAKRAVESKRKIFAPRPNLPPLTTFPPPVPVPSASARRLPATEETSPGVRSTVAETTVFEIRESSEATAPNVARTGHGSNANIMELLKSPSIAQRDRSSEVFGPPRSLQPLELP